MDKLAVITARAVKVPLRRPLVTSGGTVALAPLVLIDVQSSAGEQGHAYIFCYTPAALKSVTEMVCGLGEWVLGEEVVPKQLASRLWQRLRLLGPQGITGMAVAGIDMAVWDLFARSHGKPLVQILGGAPQAIPAYNSCGLGIIGVDKVAAEAKSLIAEGFRAIKIRLGYPRAQDDLAAVCAVRDAVGQGIVLMADYNQSLSVVEAKRRVEVLAETDLEWIEEPTTAHDYIGHAQIRQHSPIAIQLGENAWGSDDIHKALRAQASDLIMPDAMKIGGVTGWLEAAALAAAQGMPMSSHLFPEISAHLLAVSPTAHWLEYVDWAAPLLKQPVEVTQGMLQATEVPGVGIEWDEQAVSRYAA